MDKYIDQSVRTSLQRTYINYQAWARENNIYHKIMSLEDEIWGFVYLSSNHNYYIIIDKNLTKEMQKEVFCHEVEHIMNDLPKEGYIIGVDMQYSELEQKTNRKSKKVAEEATSYFG